MLHIKNILDKNIKSSGFKKQIDTALIIKDFERELQKEFGDDILNIIIPIYLKNKQLYIKSQSSSASSEFNLKKQDIIEKINLKFGQSVLNDIRLTIG